jgi:hypothetical protein
LPWWSVQFRVRSRAATCALDDYGMGNVRLPGLLACVLVVLLPGLPLA